MQYFCTSCGEIYDPVLLRSRCGCGGALEFSLPPVSLTEIDQERSGVWRYASLLPPVPENERISLGEQATPLLMSDLGAGLKLDYLLPSGSYKDRGAAVLVSRLAALGVKDIVLDSSGNAGAAVSAYCAAAGIACRVFVPAGNSPGKLEQIVGLGATLEHVAGQRRDATDAALEAAEDSLYASPRWSPDFGAGVATLAFELWEQFAGHLPSSVLAPCGNGGIILGLYRGFDALARGGLIDRLPRLIAVQAAAFDSVADAIANGRAEPVPRGAGQRTVAEGIACELPVNGRQVLDAIRSSSGTAVAVSEEDIKSAAVRLADSGFYVEATAAAGFAGLTWLRHHDADDQLGESPLVILTGSGLKSASLLADLRDPAVAAHDLALDADVIPGTHRSRDRAGPE
jgi:threonine synthase